VNAPGAAAGRTRGRTEGVVSSAAVAVAGAVAGAVAASAAFFGNLDCRRRNECPASTRRTCAPYRPLGSFAVQSVAVADADVDT